MTTQLPFLKLFNSENNYFDQPEAKLTENRIILERYLLEQRRYSPAQVKIYIRAYNYFCVNPLHFDGSTMTEDLYDIDNLELCSMLHDYLYIKLKVAGDVKYRLMADILFRKEMKRQGKSSWNRGARFVLLIIAMFVFQHVWYCRFFKNRKMTLENKIEMDGIFCTLNGRTPRKWYNEFWREILWVVILTISLIFILN